MDRDRLKEVHQTDLTESRVNEDFVDWLKDKGPSWLLAILVAVTAYLGIVRWKQHGARKVDTAWAALSEASLPTSKVEVADEHDTIFAVPEFALLSGGAQLLSAVQNDRTIESAAEMQADPNATPAPLDEAVREHYLRQADEMFTRVVDRDDDTTGYAIHAIHAMNGRAAVAEARGDLEAARGHYERAAERARAVYPRLADQAEQRIATLDQLEGEIVFAAAPPATPREPTHAPAVFEPALGDLVTPPADDAGE